jgi:restriction system protein
MARRKSAIDIFLDFLGEISPLYIFYLIYLWFVNKANFWRWVIYGITFFVILFVIIYWRRKIRFKKGKQWLSDRDLIQILRRMKPWEFEDYIADLFRRMGYKTETTGGPYDRGVDVIAEKDGIKHYIQCKKYFRWHEVGVAEVREFYGAIADHLANGNGYFITTNKFTLEAKRFADDKPIELIDGFKLIKYIRSVEK